MADWVKIRNEYISGGGTYRELSEKHGVPLRTLAKHAKDEKWQQGKEEYGNAVASALQQKSIEKTAEAESEIAAIKSRINLRLMQMIEASLPTIKAGDTDRLRKVVQSYKDMCELKGNQDTGGDNGTGVVMMPEVMPFE